MGSTKWIYHTERSLASNYFNFLKILFLFKNLLWRELIWCICHANVHFHTFRKRWSFIWMCFFRMSILKTYVMKLLWLQHFKYLRNILVLVFLMIAKHNVMERITLETKDTFLFRILIACFIFKKLLRMIAVSRTSFVLFTTFFLF